MSVDLRLPDLGEGIEEADVLSVLVSVGQAVDAGDSVIEIESEKATLEVPTDAAGTITGIHVKSGDTIAVGQPVLTLESDGAETPPAAAGSEAQPQVDEAPGPSADGAPDGAEAAPRRASVDSTTAGVGPDVHVARPFTDAESDADGRPVAAAPSVRIFAREIGVDVRQVEGSGPGGRISMDDVKAHARRRPSAPAPDIVMPLPDFAQWGPIERVRLSRLRRTLADNLTGSWTTIPHVTLFQEADVTDVEALRAENKERAAAQGAKLTITAFILPVVAAALKAHPEVNASLDLAAGEIVRKGYYHLGVAADTERGLLVPVVRDVDTKGVIEIAAELTDIAERARAGKLTPDEMQGATFTISNLGGLGTGFFTPIVNPPEVGILGVGRAVPRPTLQNDAMQTRLMLPLSLSFDHRALDGADGARFLSWIVDALQRPTTLAMES
ncbi:MAG: dihydrolipoamide acetyltransferase family protein [Chloroflexi bacterium]|nr:dihydrolipoamide acetyltransferase family protein [Chloroflexota bacterium]